jgi:hypothetical protein
MASKKWKIKMALPITNHDAISRQEKTYVKKPLETWKKVLIISSIALAAIAAVGGALFGIYALAGLHGLITAALVIGIPIALMAKGFQFLNMLP